MGAVLRTTQKRVAGLAFIPIPIQPGAGVAVQCPRLPGQSHRDALERAAESFINFLAGANVDPYRQLGQTRLFVIELIRNQFRLFIAPDVDTDAPPSEQNVNIYPQTDAGILQMYDDLSASDIFPPLPIAMCPVKVDLASGLEDRLMGYDPDTGLRRILLGSAMAQAVPAGQFAQVKNKQIYDPAPAIVPLATSLVYDVSTNNEVGAKTLVLLIAYVVDQATPGQSAVNRFGATQASGVALRRDCHLRGRPRLRCYQSDTAYGH